MLTDVLMPELNGRELHERIQANQPAVPAPSMSGYTDTVIAIDSGVPAARCTLRLDVAALRARWGYG